MKLEIINNISKIMNSVINKGIKIYPVREGGQWYVHVNNNGVPKRFNKPISANSILKNNELIEPLYLTYYYYYQKLKKIK